MHDLTATLALGGDSPKTATIGQVTLQEVPGLALASVTARRDRAEDCLRILASLLGSDAPGPDAAVLSAPYAAVWIGPESWMVGAPLDSHEDIARELKQAFGDAASITEQSDAWVTIDLAGAGTVDLMERLCPVPARRMQAGDARRTTLHQMGCFVLCGEAAAFFRILGPRSSAGSLWHALEQAARSIA